MIKTETKAKRGEYRNQIITLSPKLCEVMFHYIIALYLFLIRKQSIFHVPGRNFKIFLFSEKV